MAKSNHEGISPAHSSQLASDAYFLKPGYRVNSSPKRYDDSEEDNLIYQLPVYEMAASLAKERSLASVLDVGCGHGIKLDRFLRPVCSRIVGVDQEHSIKFCRDRHQFGDWRIDDIENPDPDFQDTFDLIICADVIEHLVNPDQLLTYIMRHSRPDTLIVISTPERDLRRGRDDMGPPGNPAHVREWNCEELTAYIRSQNFEILAHQIVELREGMKTCQMMVCKIGDSAVADTYGSVWDTYVDQKFPAIQQSGIPKHRILKPWQVLNSDDNQLDWPGDEWGSANDVDSILDSTLYAHIQDAPERILEIGAGSGRFTHALLNHWESVRIVDFDVSSAFIDSIRKRCAHQVDQGRLETVLLKGEDPREIQLHAEANGYAGEVDAVVSWDAMVHVDLHTLCAYWVTAARILKPDGLLSMSIADAETEYGFHKLLVNTPYVYKLRGGAGGQFQWASTGIIRSTLGRLGFEILQLTHENDRDAFVVARLRNPQAARACMVQAGAKW